MESAARLSSSAPGAPYSWRSSLLPLSSRRLTASSNAFTQAYPHCSPQVLPPSPRFHHPSLVRTNDFVSSSLRSLAHSSRGCNTNRPPSFIKFLPKFRQTLPLERAELDTGRQVSLARKLSLTIPPVPPTYMTVPVSSAPRRAQPRIYLRRTRSRVQNIEPSKLPPSLCRFRLSTLRPRRCTL